MHFNNIMFEHKCQIPPLCKVTENQWHKKDMFEVGKMQKKGYSGGISAEFGEMNCR